MKYRIPERCHTVSESNNAVKVPPDIYDDKSTDNPDEWINQVVARFYRKDEVYLDEDAHDTIPWIKEWN